MFENNESKAKSIGVRVREEERELIKKVAKAKGYKNVSEYVLALIKKDIENNQ